MGAAGVFRALWQAGMAEYDEMEGIAWRWQSIDGALVKAPLAQESVGANPTDWGGNGSKRMLLVDAHGIPLSLIVSGANWHDVSQLGATLDAFVVPRPPVTPRTPQHLWADAGFVGIPALNEMLAQDYTPHVRPRGEERTERSRGTRARRWVVEVALSWFNRFRKLLVRYEKTHRAYLALTMLAAAIICFRHVPGKVNIVYGKVFILPPRYVAAGTVGG